MIDTSKFKPADASSAAARASLEMARAAGLEARADLGRAEEARNATLLDGSAKERTAAQAHYAAARDNVEVIEAAVAQLAQRLEAAQRNETIGAVTERLAELSQINEAANRFWDEKGELLVDLLRQGTVLANKQGSAQALVRIARNRVNERYPDQGMDVAMMTTDVTMGSTEAWAEAIRDARAPG